MSILILVFLHSLRVEFFNMSIKIIHGTHQHRSSFPAFHSTLNHKTFALLLLFTQRNILRFYKFFLFFFFLLFLFLFFLYIFFFFLFFLLYFFIFIFTFFLYAFFIIFHFLCQFFLELFLFLSFLSFLFLYIK